MDSGRSRFPLFVAEAYCFFVLVFLCRHVAKPTALCIDMHRAFLTPADNCFSVLIWVKDHAFDVMLCFIGITDLLPEGPFIQYISLFMKYSF